MERPGGLRRRALALRAAILAFIATALFAAAFGSHAQRVLAQVLPVPGYGTPLPQGSPTPTPSASPSPTPAPARPTIAPAPRVIRGGPISFGLTGALTLGQRMQSTASDFGGTQTESQANDSAGMLATVRRRTATTTLQFGLPIGFDLRQSDLRTTSGRILYADVRHRVRRAATLTTWRSAAWADAAGMGVPHADSWRRRNLLYGAGDRFRSNHAQSQRYARAHAAR